MSIVQNCIEEKKYDASAVVWYFEKQKEQLTLDTVYKLHFIEVK